MNTTTSSESAGPDGRPDADVIPLYGTPGPKPGRRPGGRADTRPDTGPDTGSDRRPVIGPDGEPVNESHFDVPLDEEAQPGGAPVDALPPAPRTEPMNGGTAAGGLRPVIPANLRGWQNIKNTLREAVIGAGLVTAFHLVRSPWYAVQAVFWAAVGVFVLIGRQLRWWWLAEQHTLRQQAAADNDPQTWVKLHREVKATRRWRFIVLCAQAAALGIGVPVMLALAPWPVLAATMVGAVMFLAGVGRPADRSIITKAVVTGRFRRVNPDIVLRAYYAAGLGHPDKPGQQVTFGSPMSRDSSGTGSLVSIDLPYGKTYTGALNAREAIASGLDVSVNQVYLTGDPTSQRRHTLFVLDRDPLGIPAGRSPLLDCKVRDIWSPAPFGLDERSRKVFLELMWVSILIGAQPRKGKTFAARVLALFAALDPYVTILLADGKNSPDWDKFRLVAHRAVFGTVPNARDTDPVTHLIEMLIEVRKHIDQVNEFLSTLPTSECPEGKITRELSRKYPQLRVWLLVMEEFHLYYELDDQNVNKEIAGHLSHIKAVGPSAGVIILSSTQKPSGIGAGDVARIFNRYRDNHDVRFALKCGNRTVSDAILGGDAYSDGFDASALPTGPQYRGVGILYGATDDTPIVRTYLADHGDAEKILTAARRHRQAIGTLSGLAAGEHTRRDVRDVLADVHSIFQAGEPGLHWQHVATRLASTYPEHYADISPDAISAQLRALDLPTKLRSVDVKVSGETLKGIRLAAITTAMTDRQPAPGTR